MNKRYLVSTSILIIAFMACMLIFWQRMSTSTFSPEKPAHFADAIIENIHIVRFDSNGAPIYNLHAPRTIHYHDNDQSVFVDPQLLTYDDQHQLWKMQAKYARSTEHFDTLWLKKNVIFQQLTTDSKEELTYFVTSAFTLYPQRKLGETNQFVTLRQGINQLTATGVKANFHSGIINLLSQVKSIYVVEDPKPA